MRGDNQQANLVHKVNLNLMDIASFIVQNFGKNEFNTVQLRIALRHKYNLQSGEDLLVTVPVCKKDKVKYVTQDCLTRALIELRKYETIVLVGRKYGKDGDLDARIYRVKSENCKDELKTPEKHKKGRFNCKTETNKNYEELALAELG